MLFLLSHRDTIRHYFFIAIAAFGIFYYGYENLLLSVIAYYIVWHILQPCWWHYDLWHWGLIKSSNTIHSIHSVLYCFFFPHDPTGPIKVHSAHHKNVNTSNDQNTVKVNQGRLKHLFGLTKPGRVRNAMGDYKIPDFYMWNFCCKHYLIIFLVTNIVFMILSPKLYIFLHAVPFLIGKFNLVVKSHDIAWHFKPEKNFVDKPYMFLLSFTDAWHTEHHKNPIVLNFGPGLYKWLNPQFYYLCLIDRSIRKKVLNFSNYKFSRE